MGSAVALVVVTRIHTTVISCRHASRQSTLLICGSVSEYIVMCFFFFQAEDGIRDCWVTGVQTCALPISSRRRHTNCWVTGVQTCALPIDRKSTRLNSSHPTISYAVFCLDRKSAV